MSVSINGTNGLTFSDGTSQNTGATGFGFKNRIINGAMMIDQRNAGASVTITNTSGATYTIDRWFGYGSQASKFTIQQNAGSVTPPVGFTNYVGVTSSASTSLGASDQFLLGQYIEGFNCADLGWGASGASTVTLSFWVRSSLTGTFGGVLTNDGYNRSYPFSYTISAANTWEQKSITITGDTTGTWLKNNGTGIRVIFGLGVGSTLSGTAGSWSGSTFVSATGATSVVGTNGATFYITGVQLEKGSTATSFDYRPYGTELQLCQRYYERSYNEGVATGTGLADGWYGFVSPTTSTENNALITFKVSKRVSPTVTVYNAVSGASGAAYRVSDAVSVGITLARIGHNNIGVAYTASGNVNTYYYHWVASSEL